MAFEPVLVVAVGGTWPEEKAEASLSLESTEEEGRAGEEEAKWGGGRERFRSSDSK